MSFFDDPKNRWLLLVAVIIWLSAAISYEISVSSNGYAPGGATLAGNTSFTELSMNIAPGQLVEVTITDADGIVWDAVIKDGIVIEKTEWRGAGDD